MTLKRNNAWYKSLQGKTVGEFNLLAHVGSGKIGHVYRAQSQKLPDCERAIKLIFDTLNPELDTELKKVVRLAQIPGVVQFHDLGTDRIDHKGEAHLCQYTVWDYIAPGENLKKYLKRLGQIQTSFLLAVVERILHVLHACHEKGVPRHGDLHSGNILIGEATGATLDDSLQPRAPIFVSDFGYGATGAAKMPKDDYEGLARIVNEMVRRVDYARATSTHRQILRSMQSVFGKLLREPEGPERQQPLELLRVLTKIKSTAQSSVRPSTARAASDEIGADESEVLGARSVGQFQVSEMIGERWEWWKRLFVPTVPARSKILALDVPTVVTGPRGCGKTMLFRRLSERLVVECGEVNELPICSKIMALYVNANDFSDAFSHFPNQPTPPDEAKLTCYANLCVLADLLTVQSARAGLLSEPVNDGLLALVQQWLNPEGYNVLAVGEDRLEPYRDVLEQIKWRFPNFDSGPFPGFDELSQHRWLPRFVQQVRGCCPWIGDRSVLLFIDDFSTPRVSPSMQRVLNRLFLQRAPDFLAKVATEAWTTFVPEDSSGKNLQDGDDYLLVDIGEESLFLPDDERLAFLNEVFSRRLGLDPRVPTGHSSLKQLLGRLGLSKTQFARNLRSMLGDQPSSQRPAVHGKSQRRGRSRALVHYHGEDVFSNLWSGDTRTMIQLITDVVDHAPEASHSTGATSHIALPVRPDLQDRTFRERGGEWLTSQTRNEPTDPQRMNEELERHRQSKPQYKLVGEYGDHLKAIVEAFGAAAKVLLLGPMYTMGEGPTQREVPRMAFRLEIVDEFRIDGLAGEIYRDLIRYGLFLRDNRGKSVRGAFVPRLYLRRLLLPYCTLALSKRDSVPLTCEAFTQLLLEPDAFKARFPVRRAGSVSSPGQLSLIGLESPLSELSDPAYDDLSVGDAVGGPEGDGANRQGDESSDFVDDIS